MSSRRNGSRASSFRIAALIFIALGLGVTTPALAATSLTTGHGDENQFTARGYSQDQLYFAIGGAEVNAFNFNMVMSLTEQVGFGTPVDGGLDLKLSRVYNSNLYRQEIFYTHRSCGPSGAGPAVTLDRYIDIPRQNPLGLGWEFHLGRIYKQAGVFCPETLETLKCYGLSANPPFVLLTEIPASGLS